VATLVLTSAAYVPLVDRFVEFHKANEDRYREIGRRLRPLAAADRWLLFYDVGSLVYEAEWNTLDEVSLNTHRKWRQPPCNTRPDVVLRGSSRGGPVPNPCPGLYTLAADLPFATQEPLVDSSMKVFARTDLPYASELQTRLLSDWPGRFARPVDWRARYSVLVGWLLFRS
jgi:hypothetical protein